MPGKTLTYKQIKSIQKKDLKSKSIVYDIYRNFSTPLTYVFVKLGVSANQITILSILLYVIGGLLLSLGQALFFILGLGVFIFNRILDDCDGEVARIHDARSIEGVYLDRLGHYVLSLSLGLGFGFGLYRLYQHDIYISLAFIFALVLVLDNAIKDSVKSLLRANIMKIGRKKLNELDLGSLDESLYQRFLHNMHGKRSWDDGNIISKLAGMYPFQGILYTETFIIPLLLALAVVAYALTSFPAFYTPVFWLMPLYISAICISKIIWIAITIYKIEKSRPVTKTLKDYT